MTTHPIATGPRRSQYPSWPAVIVQVVRKHVQDYAIIAATGAFLCLLALVGFWLLTVRAG